LQDNSTYHYRNLKDLGDCHAAMGDLKHAKISYEQAASVAPLEAAPQLDLASLAIQGGRFREAKEHYQKAIALNPASSEAYGGFAVACHQLNECASAFEAYMKCLELDQDNLVALLGLFQTSRQMGTFAQITKYLEIYLHSHDDDTAVLFCLATLYARDSRFDLARQAVLKVLSIEPEKPDAMNLLRQVEKKLTCDGPLDESSALANHLRQ
jgi:tetratricopeptide (TPR) repeat protein